jgi:hypothetical protein
VKARRAFSAPPEDQRCRYDITLPGDKSEARCMRRAVSGDLCRQHAKIAASSKLAPPRGS